MLIVSKNPNLHKYSEPILNNPRQTETIQCGQWRN